MVVCTCRKIKTHKIKDYSDKPRQSKRRRYLEKFFFLIMSIACCNHDTFRCLPSQGSNSTSCYNVTTGPTCGNWRPQREIILSEISIPDNTQQKITKTNTWLLHSKKLLWDDSDEIQICGYDTWIDTNVEVIVVPLTTWWSSPQPEGCGEIPRSLLIPQWPKLRYQFLFYYDQTN